MIRRDTDDQDSSVPMAPLIDMVFLLLIFFLVTASLKKPHKEIPIELPNAAHSRDARYEDELIITITADGERYLDDGHLHRNQAPVSRGDLVQVLADVAAEDPDMVIRLDIDRRVQYYHLMDIADLLHLYELRNMHMRSAHGVHDEYD